MIHHVYVPERAILTLVGFAEVFVPDIPRLLIDGGRAERPALVALPF